jgi:hypothetical protein
MGILERAGLLNKIGRDMIFEDLEDVMTAFERRWSRVDES